MNEAATREGFAGSFMNGIFATALATPCTAPILAPALGYLIQLPPLLMGAGIMTVGLGLAAPYVLLTAFPGWLRFLPKPGNWMVTFKQFMGFVLLGTVVWLMWILFDLVDKGRFFTTLSCFCAVGLACWIVGRLTLSASMRKYTITWGSALAVLAIGWFVPSRLLAKDPDAIQWRKWEPGIAKTLSEQGYTVYVDFTATWCLTCQANKTYVLETTDIRRKLQELNVVPIKADFTLKPPAIQEALNRHNRAGVPLNIIFPAGRPDDVIVLPALLTKSTVIEALDRAGKSTAEDPPDVDLVTAGLP
ncbi:MAG: thioredoxin family protein, partial [Planctomycetes bacterium]|nr:thioredoxin family protein [Planctomycetota bacterium]